MSHSNKRKIAQLERIASGRRAGGLSDVWHRMKKNKPAMAGLVIITIFILAAIFADLIANFDTLVVAQNTAIRLQPPNAQHWFGTDGYGRDIFARVVHGARVSLSIAFLTTAVSSLAGGLRGSDAG